MIITGPYYVILVLLRKGEPAKHINLMHKSIIDERIILRYGFPSDPGAY